MLGSMDCASMDAASMVSASMVGASTVYVGTQITSALSLLVSVLAEYGVISCWDAPMISVNMLH